MMKIDSLKPYLTLNGDEIERSDLLPHYQVHQDIERKFPQSFVFFEVGDSYQCYGSAWDLMGNELELSTRSMTDRSINSDDDIEDSTAASWVHPENLNDLKNLLAIGHSIRVIKFSIHDVIRTYFVYIARLNIEDVNNIRVSLDFEERFPVKDPIATVLEESSVWIDKNLIRYENGSDRYSLSMDYIANSESLLSSLKYRLDSDRLNGDLDWAMD